MYTIELAANEAPPVIPGAIAVIVSGTTATVYEPGDSVPVLINVPPAE